VPLPKLVLACTLRNAEEGVKPWSDSRTEQGAGRRSVGSAFFPGKRRAAPVGAGQGRDGPAQWNKGGTVLVHGAVGVLFRVLWGLLLVLLLALPLLSWRLGQGPLTLDAITPAIEQALSDEESGMRITLGHTVLMAGEGVRLIEIHALDVRITVLDDPQPVIVVPDMSFSLNLRALLVGRLAPDSIRLAGMRLKLIREADGRIHLGLNAGGAEPEPASGAVIDRIRDALLGVPDSARPGRTLNAFSITHAAIEVEDRGRGVAWRVPEADLSFRRIAAGLTVSGRLRFDLEGEPAHLAFDADYRQTEGVFELAAQIGGLRPARLAGLDPALQALAGIDVPLSGEMWGRFDAEGQPLRLDLAISAQPGAIRLAAPLTGTVRLAGGTVRINWRHEGDRLDLTELRLDFGGPSVVAAGSAEGLAGGTGGALNFDATVCDVPVDRLRDLWPQGLGENAREWVVANLSKGLVREATLSLVGHLPAGKSEAPVVTRLGGAIHAEGVTVDYLKPMPPARGVVADVVYDAHEMRIGLRAGETEGLRLRDGMVVLGGLDQVDQFADIALSLGGPLTGALTLLDSPPLGYARALGIEPNRVGGTAETRLSLKFPLVKTLRLEDLEIRAEASLKGLSLPKVALNQDLESGQLELVVDGKGLDANGTVVLGGVPASLSWRENFSARNAPFRSRYHLKAAQFGEDARRRFGLDSEPFVAPMLSGPIGADVTITLGEAGRGEIEGRFDLAPARMVFEPLGWSKEPGKPGLADLVVRLERRQLAAVSSLTVQASGLDLHGTVGFDSEGAARRVEFSRLAVGRTQGQATLLLPPGGGLDVSFTGASLDLAPALSSKDDDQAAETTAPPLTMSAKAKRLWVSETGALSEATLSLRREGGDWRSLSLHGGLDGGKSVSVAIAPGTDHRRTLSLHSDDAGAVARTFDLYGDLVGGELKVEGTYDDTRPSHPLTGRLQVSDYQIRNAPALARLLTVTSLTGILDLLRGEGVSFSALEAPFVFSDGLLELKDGRAWGPALGITAKGQIDLDRSRIAIEGTVVPAYVLNSALGQIPLLGWLMTSGEEGGGVIAFRYAMKGSAEDPSVSVNPLSALTPGFLRRLFNLFDDGSGTEVRSP